MENWRKRAAVLIGFSLALGILLVLVRGIGSGERPAPSAPPPPKPDKLNISTAAPLAPVEEENPPAEPASPASAARTPPPAPATATTPRRSTGPLILAPPASSGGVSADQIEKAQEAAAREFAFRSLFSSRGLENQSAVDRDKIEQSVHDYVEEYCQDLNLSPSDEQDLVDLVVDFREANLKLRSLSGSTADAAELKENLKKMQTSMDEFRSMTIVESEPILRPGTPKALFGDEPTNAEDDSFGIFQPE